MGVRECFMRYKYRGAWFCSFQFDFVARFLEESRYPVFKIALDNYFALLGASAGTAFFPQFAPKFLEVIVVAHKTGNQGHHFSFSLFTVDPNEEQLLRGGQGLCFLCLAGFETEVGVGTVHHSQPVFPVVGFAFHTFTKTQSYELRGNWQ
jgi:hypothetical protein